MNFIRQPYYLVSLPRNWVFVNIILNKVTFQPLRARQEHIPSLLHLVLESSQQLFHWKKPASSLRKYHMHINTDRGIFCSPNNKPTKHFINRVWRIALSVNTIFCQLSPLRAEAWYKNPYPNSFHSNIRVTSAYEQVCMLTSDHSDALPLYFNKVLQSTN